MGAVAAAMRQNGFVVSGQDDNVYPPMSTFLAEQRHRRHEGLSTRGYSSGGSDRDRQCDDARKSRCGMCAQS